MSPSVSPLPTGPLTSDTTQIRILWATEGWELARQLVIERLPSWARLQVLNPSRPLVEQVKNIHVIIPITCPRIPDEVVHNAPKLRLINQPGAGYGNVPVEVAKDCSIAVCNLPGVNATTVAESTIMMLLMLARRVPETLATFQCRQMGGPLGMQLRGKTLGIIGMGAIGKEVARIAGGLGMHVLAVNSRSSTDELDALLQESHAISLHCPHTPATAGLIGERAFRLMRPGAILLNFARGEIIDKKALISALDRKQLWGVGLDAHWVEPADPSDPVYHYHNVIATPHAGAGSQEVFEAMADTTVDNIVRLKEGRPLLNRIV
ncbi:hypothetical protein WJX74_007834 [Apatococcus lobatus]|uniref:Uncharacterized protein n=1 Tax=Apatococcus lobatus TaxID=904363 RepID=A0AAW1QTG7_9CHLO